MRARHGHTTCSRQRLLPSSLGTLQGGGRLGQEEETVGSRAGLGLPAHRSTPRFATWPASSQGRPLTSTPPSKDTVRNQVLGDRSLGREWLPSDQRPRVSGRPWSPLLKYKRLQAGCPFAYTTKQTPQDKHYVFLGRYFCKTWLLFIQKHQNVIFCQMFSRFSS